MEKQLINIILLGAAFMILSTAQQTTNMLAVLDYFEFYLLIVFSLLLFLLAKCIRRSEE